jgi:hypothetical protein
MFLSVILTILLIFCTSFSLSAQEKPLLSKETQICLSCHRIYTPGIVQDWQKSRHSQILPEEALKKPALEQRISTKDISPNLSKVVVGCYECHALNPEKHKDNFAHMGYKINVVVSPNDCQICHPTEVNQYSGSKKAYALGNLKKNALYSTLVETIIGLKEIKADKIVSAQATEFTKQETCFACHGTEIEVLGKKEIETTVGKIEVPNLSNWPNQGVGRKNPDGSLGSCAACHPRHSFSIEIARKPYTCAQCHLEPDVPAWNVYKESKHGNIYFSKYEEWNLKEVPWKLGQDFQAPTCATCHNSLVVKPDGKILTERTHDFAARLWVRLFGLVYSHPQPKQGDTSIIKNKDGLPLPTTFAGELAAEYLISEEEQINRQTKMKTFCNGCHSSVWISGHFAKMDNTTKETDKMTISATKLLAKVWELNLADKTNPFDEAIEQKWVKQWLFYCNSIRYASAMTGAPDYAAFKLGWWELTNNLQEMNDWFNLRTKQK